MRHVEQLGHHALEALGFLAVVAGHALALILEQLGIEVDAGEWRFQPVRHGGQEVRLHLVELFEIGYVAQSENVAHEFGLLRGFVERHQIPHRQPVKRLFAALGNVQQRRFDHSSLAAGGVEGPEHSPKQVVFEAYGVSRSAHQFLHGHPQKFAAHGVRQ